MGGGGGGGEGGLNFLFDLSKIVAGICFASWINFVEGGLVCRVSEDLENEFRNNPGNPVASDCNPFSDFLLFGTGKPKNGLRDPRNFYLGRIVVHDPNPRFNTAGYKSPERDRCHAQFRGLRILNFTSLWRCWEVTVGYFDFELFKFLSLMFIPVFSWLQMFPCGMNYARLLNSAKLFQSSSINSNQIFWSFYAFFFLSKQLLCLCFFQSWGVFNIKEYCIALYCLWLSIHDFVLSQAFAASCRAFPRRMFVQRNTSSSFRKPKYMYQKILVIQIKHHEILSSFEKVQNLPARQNSQSSY